MGGMRAALALLLLAGCPADDDGATDAAIPFAPCTPTVVGDSTPTGASPPVGTFDISWVCEEGCDGAPPVVADADRMTLIVTRPGEASITWSIGDERITDGYVTERDGCWYEPASIDGCRAEFYVCGSADSASIDSLTWRIQFEDFPSPTQRWSMR